MRRYEVFKHRHSFSEICPNRHFNNGPGRIGHKPSHARYLSDLIKITLGGTRIAHHEHRTHRIQVCLNRTGNFCHSIGPVLHRKLIPFRIGNKTFIKIILNHANGRVSLCQNILFHLWNFKIPDANGHARFSGPQHTEGLELVSHVARSVHPSGIKDTFYHTGQPTLIEPLIHKTKFPRKGLVQHDPSHRSLHKGLVTPSHFLNREILRCYPNLNLRLKVNRPMFICKDSVFKASKGFTFP